MLSLIKMFSYSHIQMELTKSVKKTRFFTFSEYLTIKKQKNRKMVVTAKNGGKKVTLLVHLENYFKMLKFRIWASFTLMLPKNCVEHLRIFSGAFYPPPRPPPGEMICISNIYRYKPCCSQLYSLCFISALAPPSLPNSSSLIPSPNPFHSSRPVDIRDGHRFLNVKKVVVQKKNER